MYVLLHVPSRLLLESERFSVVGINMGRMSTSSVYFCTCSLPLWLHTAYITVTSSTWLSKITKLFDNVPGFSQEFRRLAKLNYSCVQPVIVYTNCTFSCRLVIINLILEIGYWKTEATFISLRPPDCAATIWGSVYRRISWVSFVSLYW